VGGYGLESCRSGKGQVVYSCEHGNEPFGSIKDKVFSLAKWLPDSQDHLCSMVLVS
jgi:hypothetical protein